MNNEADIFEVAAALHVAERERYLDPACAERPEMRARVEALLRSHDLSGFGRWMRWTGRRMCLSGLIEQKAAKEGKG